MHHNARSGSRSPATRAYAQSGVSQNARIDLTSGRGIYEFAPEPYSAYLTVMSREVPGPCKLVCQVAAEIPAAIDNVRLTHRKHRVAGREERSRIRGNWKPNRSSTAANSPGASPGAREAPPRRMRSSSRDQDASLMTTLLPCELDQPRELIQRIPDTNAASVGAEDIDAHEQRATAEPLHIRPRQRYRRAVRQTLFDPHRCYVNVRYAKCFQLIVRQLSSSSEMTVPNPGPDYGWNTSPRCSIATKSAIRRALVSGLIAV